MTRWCCLGFKGHFESEDNRGSCVVIERDSDGRCYFRFRYRGIAKKDEARLDSSIPVSIVHELRLVFCPWCGRRLHRWYRKELDQLISASERLSVVREGAVATTLATPSTGGRSRDLNGRDS